MEKFIECEHCGTQISDTAIKCPVCGKSKKSLGSSVKALGALGAGAGVSLLVGPAGLVAFMASGIMDVISTHGIREIAKKVKAIDSFALSDDALILVNDTKFIIIVSDAVGAVQTPLCLRSDLIGAKIDEAKSIKGGVLSSEKTVVHLEYLDPESRNNSVMEDVVFKGKHSRMKAEFALVKLLEYKFPAG